MKTNATNRKISELVSALRDEKLLMKPPFQRRLVWTHKDKIRFLKTVLERYPFPEIFIATGELNPDTGETIDWLVDGQQRISTIYQYFTGDLPISRGELQPYRDLSKDEKTEFLEYVVVVRDLGSVSKADIVEVFERINSTSYNLNAMELENARYAGAFSTFGQELADHEFFTKHGIFSASDVRRMRDLRFALRLAITAMTTYFQGTTKLPSYLEEYNDEFVRGVELLGRFNEIFSLIESLRLSAKLRVWQQADIFSLISELYFAKYRNSLQPKSTALARSLKAFFEIFDDDYALKKNTDALRYLDAATKATNNRNSQIIRGEILGAIIKDASRSLPLLEAAEL